MTFQPHSELVEDMRRRRQDVEVVLERLAAGVAPSDAEREHVDVKEEAGRRGAGGIVLPGTPQNTQAAQQLADEVACMANTPGGGALIVGVDDKSGDVLGTALDPEWLRHEIYRRIDVAPQVEQRTERGIRVLVLYVPEAREPVEDTGNRLRWRVGANCVPVDRGEWWRHRQGRAGWDSMARPSSRLLSDARTEALATARAFLRRRDEDDLADQGDRELLRRLGVLTVDDQLTEAGALLFCASPRPWLSWSRLDVRGGDVLAQEDNFSGTSLLEQVRRVEDLIDAANDRVTLVGSFSERTVRLIPTRAAREAVMNGVVHRDWAAHEPTAVVWTESDSTLDVTSPGGFVGGVSETNALTQRFSRSPALADAVRALGLVDKQGIGIDRMYREMVVLGHRPPSLREEPGPRVRAHLAGGVPAIPIMSLISLIKPVVRQRDVQVALVVHTLLHHPFTTPELLAPVLQRTVEEADEALEIAASCVIEEAPLLTRFRDTWQLSPVAINHMTAFTGDIDVLRRRGVLWYHQPDPSLATKLVRSWLSTHDRISSGDYSAMTGYGLPASRRALERLVDEDVLRRGTATGRNAHFVEAADTR